MTAHTILTHPDPRLELVSEKVTAFDASLARLADDLVDTLRAEGPAIGLSAPQLDDRRKVLVIDMSGQGTSPTIYVNPIIVARTAFGIAEERCLSVPGVVVHGWRATQLRVVARDPEGAEFERTLEGMEAVCLQHELDHFAGKTLVDRMFAPRRWLYRWRTPAPA
jgi:peptide deformylase